jgi:hypothetical protein
VQIAIKFLCGVASRATLFSLVARWLLIFCHELLEPPECIQNKAQAAAQDIDKYLYNKAPSRSPSGMSCVFRSRGEKDEARGRETFAVFGRNQLKPAKCFMAIVSLLRVPRAQQPFFRRSGSPPLSLHERRRTRFISNEFLMNAERGGEWCCGARRRTQKAN